MAGSYVAGSQQRNVAIFLDMENLFGGYKNDVTSVPLATVVGDIEKVVGETGLGGQTALTRAYANWGRADMAGYRSQLLAHNIKPLERDGLIEQLRDPEDGRSRLVALTDAGRSKLVESKRLWRLAQARFEHVYGEDDAKALRSALARIHSDEFAEDFVAVGD